MTPTILCRIIIAANAVNEESERERANRRRQRKLILGKDAERSLYHGKIRPRCTPDENPRRVQWEKLAEVRGSGVRGISGSKGIPTTSIRCSRCRRYRETTRRYVRPLVEPSGPRVPSFQLGIISQANDSPKVFKFLFKRTN